MMKLLKICGMREASNINEVANLRPDFLGFIFYAQSPRYVGTDFVVPPISKDIKKVGVFVNEDLDVEQRIAETQQLDFVQLHGDESVEYVADMKKTGIGVIKAFRVDEQFDFENVTTYEPYCDYFLFDTRGKDYGGNNKVFDWRVLSRYKQQVPFLLSGGLNNENLMNAIEAVSGMKCAGFDLNSGVEVSPGVKDKNAVEKALQILNPNSAVRINRKS
jgi:phosphoribosylanthranilate isomerase